jgi:putative nucleotidyltransferase with HDIG domain
MNEETIKLQAIVTFAANVTRFIDQWEYGHAERVMRLMEKLARKMELPEDDIPLIMAMSVLHDIGKWGVSDIVRNRRKFSVSDMDTMKGHSYNGYTILKDMGFDARLPAAILQHHEWWDGSGYPNRVQGKSISLWARMLSVVDSYDAIMHQRAYHKTRTQEEVFEIMEEESGRKFDPELYELFRSMLNE